MAMVQICPHIITTTSCRIGEENLNVATTATTAVAYDLVSATTVFVVQNQYFCITKIIIAGLALKQKSSSSSIATFVTASNKHGVNMFGAAATRGGLGAVSSSNEQKRRRQ